MRATAQVRLFTREEGHSPARKVRTLRNASSSELAKEVDTVVKGFAHVFDTLVESFFRRIHNISRSRASYPYARRVSGSGHPFADCA